MKTEIKKHLKSLWIIPLVLAIFIGLKNYKFIKMYYNYLDENNLSLSFSIFTKSIANDTFFSIPLGERILEEGFKSDDILTWHKGLEFTNDRWLFNVIIYLVYKAFGISGIAHFVTICSIGIGILLFAVMKDRTKNLPLAIFGMLFAMYFSRTVFQARAQILSFPLFILEFWTLEKLIETEKKRYSILTILIVWLIANVHASVFPICIVMFLPYFAEWILGKYRNSEVKDIKILGITFLISLLAGLLTPIGFTPYTILIRAFLYTDTSFIGECQPSNIHNNLPLFVILGISLCLIILLRKEVKTRDLFLILGFGIMGILVFRGTFFFHFISSIAVIRLVSRVYDKYELGLDSRWIRYILYISLTIILSTLYLKHFLFTQRYSFVPKDLYPVDVANYILEKTDYENMRIFNSFNYGSYLEFKGIKSFIDSRSEVYTEEFNPGCTVLEDWLKVNNDSSKYKEVFDKYNITHAIVGNEMELYTNLEKDSNYNLIYTDENFSLFEKVEE